MKFHEVKMGKKLNDRGRRQRRKLNRLKAYLDNDFSLDFINDKTPAYRYPSNELKTHTNAINSLINNLIKKELAHKQVEQGLHYVVARKFQPQTLDRILQNFKNPPIAFFLNANKINDTRYPYYPLALSINNPIEVINFYKGELMILVFIDPNTLISYLTKMGLDASFHSTLDYAIEVKTPYFSMKMSQEFFNRVPFEFLSLKWMASNIENMVRAETLNRKQRTPIINLD